MSEIKQRIANSFNQVKETSGTRAGRLREIVQEAASQAMTEVKQGTAEVSTIAKESLASVVQELDQSPETPQETVVDPASKSFGALLADLFQAVKIRLIGRWQQQYPDLKHQATARATQFDLQMTERYGDRYSNLKQRLGNFKAWYQQQAEQATATQQTTLLEQGQATLETKSAAWGEAIGQKEQQVRLQMKQWLKTVADKL